MKTPLKQVLAQNVKRLMGEVPEVATQAKLAARAHMSQSSIHRILNEGTEPEIETVQKLANAIGVPIATLLTEDQADELPLTLGKYRALPASEKENQDLHRIRDRFIRSGERGRPDHFLGAT